MKENKIEELKERLETLHVIQDARLACNADDLDIREEIAEVEEEIKELQDDTNVNRENSIKNERSSIEEDIEIVENYLKDSSVNEANSDSFKNGGWEVVDLEIPKAMKHILSNYKKLKEENEELEKRIGETTLLMSPYYVRKNFVSREKIKEKMEKLKKEGNYRTIDNPSGRVHFWAEGCDYKLQVLKELLEEGEINE